jgi:hypothetical protein
MVLILVTSFLVKVNNMHTHVSNLTVKENIPKDYSML